MIQISSSSNPSYRKALKLHDSRGRKQQGRTIVFGFNEIRRAVSSGIKAEQVFVNASRNSREAENLIERFGDLGSAIFELPDELFARLCFGNRTEEVVLVANRPSTELDRFTVFDNGLYVVLEAIEKPGNVGAVFRSAVAAGVNAIFLADPLTDVFHPNAIRSSLGSVFSVPVYQGASESVKRLLLDQGIQIAAARVGGAVDFRAIDMTLATAIVVGNEHSGLSQNWNAAGVSAIKIPMCESIDSLNVAMSATVLVYEANRQRQADQ